MMIDKLGINPVSFGKFYANEKGAYELASVLTGKPELEQKFMEKLVKPLSHAEKYNVLVDGYCVNIIDNEGKLIMGIIQPSSAGSEFLGVIADAINHCRDGLRRTSYDVNPTYDFSNNGHWLNYIETAKNIIFDKENLVLDTESMVASQAAEEYAKMANETSQEKYIRFAKIFKYDG